MKRAIPAVVFALCAAWARPAAAEDPFLPFQAPDRRSARALKEDFERLSKAGDWVRAVDALQQLLDLSADEPVVICVQFLPPRFEGAGVVARRLFDALPPEGLAAWERNSRPRAEELLARGLRLRREADLAEAARRYPAPDVRRRAHEALSQLALVRGDLGAAEFQLESLYDAALAADRPQVLARLAWVCAQAGDAEGFAHALAAATAYRDASVPAGDGATTLAAFLERLQRSVSAGAALARDVRQFGGDSHGSGLSETPPPPEAVRGRFSTEFQHGMLDDSATEPFNGLRDRERFRPVFPVVSHGRVFADDGMSLLAFDLSALGADSGYAAPTWRFDAPVLSMDGAFWRDNFVAAFAPAVADGVVYAPLATRVDRPAQEIYFNGYVILYPLPHRCLHAFDERTGELLWSHDAARLAGREDAAEIAKESVASPPLVVGDDLIVATWTYEGIYDVRLVCFDRRTGRTRWRTSLVQGQQEMNLFGRPVKELFTCGLAERGGRVFVATSLGALGAVEREDGRIAWISAYRQTRISPAMAWHQTRDRDLSWWPSSIAATPEGVVAAPLDGMDLVCFDPADGAQKWTRSVYDPPNRNRWFLGVSGGRAYVLGDRVTAYDVKTGAKAWTDPDAGRLVPSKNQNEEAVGAGLLANGRIYAPTARRVVALSAETGAIVESWPLEFGKGVTPTPGNLASGDGALLFVSRDHVDVVFSAVEVLAQDEARLRRSPDDPQTCLEAGQAYAAAERFDEAVATLEHGLAHVPDLAQRLRDGMDASLRRAAYQTRSARAAVRRRTNELAGAADDLRAAVDVAREKGDAVRALFALADVLAQAGRREDAESALRRAETEFGDVVTTSDNGDRASAGALALFRLGESAAAAGRTADAVARWLDLLERRGEEDFGSSDVGAAVRARLAETAKTESALVTAAVHARAAAAFEKAKAAGDVAGLDRVARLFPDDPDVAVESALLAADMHAAAGRHRESVGVLTSLLAAPQPAAVAARALWKLSLAYRALGETVRERAVLRRLAAEAPREAVDGPTTGADAAQRELASPRFRGPAERLPDPRTPLALLWQVGAPDLTAPQARVPVGGAPPDFDGRIVLTHMGVVQFVDAATGKPAWEATPKIEVRNVYGAAGAVVIVGEDGGARDRGVVVVALSVGDGREVWRKRLPGRYWKADATLGVLYLLQVQSGAPGGGRATHSLTAVSLASGDLLGSTRTLGALSPQIVPADDAVVLVEPTHVGGGARRSLLVLDGMTLSQRGRLDLASPSSPFYAHPPATDVVATSDGEDLVAVDVVKAQAAWTEPARVGEGRTLKAVFPVAGGVVATDSADAVRLLDAATGAERWNVSLRGAGALTFDGAAADGGLFVATAKAAGGPFVAVALDVATGAERWRQTLSLSEDQQYPHPKVLQSLVAYEINERLDAGVRSRVILLDRASGKIVQEIEHPTIGKSFETVVYGPDWIAVGSTNELAVYGRPPSGK